MFHNKETPTHEVKAFRSQTMNPNVEQKRFEKHTPQKLVIRITNADLNLLPLSGGINQGGVSGSGLPLAFDVPAKLLENLPDMCYVACEQFTYSEQSSVTTADYLEDELYNIQSPLFSSTNQYVPAWSAGGGEYSTIISTIPVNNQTLLFDPSNTTTQTYKDINGNPTTSAPAGVITGLNQTAVVTGTVAGTVLTITSIGAGAAAIQVGSSISGTGITTPTVITGFGTGTGGLGTYNLRDSQTSGAVTAASVNDYSTTYFGIAQNGLPAEPYRPPVSVTTQNSIAAFWVSWEQPVLQQQVGCYVVNKQMLNNQVIPFYLTGIFGQQAYTVFSAATSTVYIQLTLVFYGLNDDERYSMVPMGIK